MEFILHLPQDIDKDGALWQIWNNFYQKVTFFQSTELYGPELSGVSSLLLFAARDQISSICSTLKMYDLDLPKLNSILQVVEQICLPYFILMFERFRYFNLKRDLSDSLDDFFNVLRKQAEMCEFGNQEEIIMKNALCSSLESESLMQFLSNKDGPLTTDTTTQYSGAESQFNKMRNIKPIKTESNLNKDRATKDTNCETFGLSRNKELKSVNTSSYIELNASVGDEDCSVGFSGNGQQNKPIEKRKIVRPAKLNTMKTEKMPKHKRAEELSSLPGDDLEMESEFTNFENNEDKLTELHDRTDADCQNDSDTKFLCWNCEECFQSLPDYKEHGETHVATSKFNCDLCQKKHRTVFRLIWHLKNHLIPQNKCEICGVAFIKPESLARHIEKHVDNPIYMCQNCPKKFTAESRLEYHILRVHSGLKGFSCELCGKTYAHKINLVNHRRWHRGEKPFVCEVCGKSHRCAGDLSKHRRVHSDKHCYVCELCGRGFNYQSALSRHRVGHTGRRPYACNVCGRTFIYSEGLRDHIKSNRCPGRTSESGYIRTRKPTKLLKSGMASHILELESKVFEQVQEASVADMKDIQDWHCMLRKEAEEGAVVLVHLY